MDSKAEKNKLRVAIEVFYNENREKPKSYTWKQFKDVKINGQQAFTKQGMYKLMIIIKMFDNLKNRIHLANENGLESLL